MSSIKTTLCIAGIEIHVYSNGQLNDIPSVFDLVFTMHGRGNTYLSMEKYAYSILKAHGESTKLKGRGLLVVSFDQRNHGHRLVDKIRNEGWDKNKTHAADMWSIIYGTSQDISLLARVLPSYIFKDREAKAENVIVSGFSLGGHVTYMSLSQDPLISAGVAVSGCPDYLSLMQGRLNNLSLSSAEKETLLSPAFIKMVQSTGPSAERLAGKEILVLKGDDDELVPFRAGEELLSQVPTNSIEIVGYPGVGHRFTEEMRVKGAAWIREWLELRAH